MNQINELINLAGQHGVGTAITVGFLLAVSSLDFHFSFKRKDGKNEIEFSISRKKN